MTVLRDRPTPRETSEPGLPQDQQDVTGRQLRSRGGKQPTADGAGDLLSKKIEAVICNGNGIVGGSYKSQSKRKEKMFNSLNVFATCLKAHAWAGETQRCQSVFHTSLSHFFLFVLQSDFGNDLKRPLSELKVEDFRKNDSLHREKQTMAVSPFFITYPTLIL